MDIKSELNTLLVDTFRNILKVEQDMMDRSGKLNIGEAHTIESIAKSDGRTITDIARDLAITLSTVTITVDRLEKKGYVERRRISPDRRQVHVFLTDKGQKVNRVHQRFHMRMAERILADFSEEEKHVMLVGIQRLNDFFRVRASETGEKNEL